MKQVYFLFLYMMLFTSILKSQTLSRISPDYPLGSIVDINIHPSGVGYAVQECGNMLKTEDHGRTWQHFSDNLPSDSYFNKIYFLNDQNANEAIYLSQNALYITNDGFNTFQKVNSLPSIGLGNDFAQLSDGTWIAVGGGIATSKDKGATWTVNPDSDLSGTAVFEYGGNVYTGFQSILRSTDHGISFTKVLDVPGTIRKFVSHGNRLIAATTDLLFESLDNGLTWSKIEAVDYYGYGGNLHVVNNTLVTITSNRINYSEDNGLTWKSIVMPEGIYRTSILSVNKFNELIIGGEDSQMFFTDAITKPASIINGNVYYLNDVAVKDGVFYTTGSLKYFQKGNVDGTSVASYLFDADNDLVEVLGDNIVFSDGNGDVNIFDPTTNTKQSVLSTGSYISDILYSKADHLSYLIARDKIYKSENDGMSWTLVKTFDQEVTGLSADQFGNVYVINQDKEVWWSVNGAIDWELYFTVPTSAYALDLYVHNDQQFYVLTSSELFYSSDKGLHFTQQQRPYNGQALYRLSEDELICLGVNGADAWIYSSTLGETMTLITTSCATVSRYAHVDEASRTIYLCGATAGIEKLVIDKPISSVDESPKILTETIYLPNPSDGIFTLSPTFEWKSGTLEVRDGNGRLILIEKSNLSTIDLSSVASGFYFAHLITEDKVYVQKLVKM